jgi:DNA repair exonuclease SbcCD ATPase subunit
MQQQFNVLNLVPDFSELYSGSLNSAHGLSAAIVLLLLTVAVGFLIFSLSKYFQANKHISFYEGLLRGLKQEDLALKQRDITQSALKHQTYGKLWKEFDETLVLSPEGDRLFNTLDAEHFFNSYTLARGLTENRLLAAVPGFLTAIGVIGTFAGLQMGLASLELSESVGVEVLKQGIHAMISGASIAFLTSVWGVFTSVVFNCIEKILERGVKKRIARLQNRIDYLYPRINAEQSLVSIADHSRNASETLNGLAEKIGDRLQEALVQVTDNIRTGLEDSLNQIMAPAIKSLVENAEQGSQEVLDNLLGKFIDGIGNVGQSQSQMMEAASQKVNTAIGDFGNQMAEFLSRMDEQSKLGEETASERQRLLEEQLKALGEQQDERQRQMGLTFETMISDLVEKLNRQQDSATERDKARTNQLTDQLQTLSEQQNDRQERLGTSLQGMIGSLVENLSQQQKSADTREKARTEQLEEQLRLIVTKNNEAVNTMGTEVSRHLEAQQSRDEARQQTFSESVSSLQKVQTSLVDRVESLISLQQQSFDAIHKNLTGLQDQFGKLAEEHRRAGGEVFNAAKQMQGVSNQLGVLSSNLKDAAITLSTDVARAAEITADLSENNQAVSHSMKNTLEGYGRLSQEMDSVAEKLKAATISAENGFSAVHGHLDDFKKALKNNIEEVQEHLGELLAAYAEKVQTQTSDRMNEWNKQTSAYIGLMTNAVRAISDIVEGMESKCNVA